MVKHYLIEGPKTMTYFEIIHTIGFWKLMFLVWSPLIIYILCILLFNKIQDVRRR